MPRAVLAAATSEEQQIVSDVHKKIARAKTDRNRHQSRIATCYKFGLPWRHQFNQQMVTDQLDEIFISEVMTVLEDFAADMLNTFTPVKSQWVDFEPVETLQPSEKGQLKSVLQNYGTVIFSEMRRSNLYQALQEAYLDLGPGTMALCIKDIGASEPLHCEAIPTPELLLHRGPYGMIDGTWREWTRMCGEEVGVLWPNAKALRENGFEKSDTTEYNIVDGVTRDWSTPAQERWLYTVMAGERLIQQETYDGKGSNPLIVSRWSRDATTAYGVGPTYRVTPAIKTLNYLQEKKLKAIDKALDPITSYEDDGVVNLEQGLTPGTWVPRSSGSSAPEVIESKNKLDAAFMEHSDLVSEIKRAHYQDMPEQPGKTPPSATQWADEAAQKARRMGTPATNLVHELQYAIIKRFAYLLAKRGVLPKVELNGKQVALQPVSPLLRAQQQEQVVRRDRWAEMVQARLGPQLAAVIIKPIEYATAQANDMGVEASLINSQAELQGALKQFAPVLQHFSGTLPQGGAPQTPPVGS